MLEESICTWQCDKCGTRFIDNNARGVDEVLNNTIQLPPDWKGTLNESGDAYKETLCENCGKE